MPAADKRKKKTFGESNDKCQRCGEPCFTPPEHACCREHNVEGPDGYCPSCKASEYLNDEAVKKQHREFLEKQEAIRLEKEAEGE